MFLKFILGSIRLVVKGPKLYYTWILILVGMIAAGVAAYVFQFNHGLIITSMRDQVSWGLYIGNFTFLVGVAAAAVMLVIPAYVYNWKPLKEIAIFGELLAISALAMCLLFVGVDMGRMDRFWHIIPLIGTLNLPISLMSWDVVVLNFYLALNFIIITYMLYKHFTKQEMSKKIYGLLILSIPSAIAIHTVTAFIYNGAVARPFWNVSILAPKFLASAFCSGPAILLILFQILRKTTKLEIKDEAIWKIAELMAYAMFINLFMTGAEIFKEYYSSSEHLVYTEYLYSGLRGHKALVPFAWMALFCNITAFFLFLIPWTRKHTLTLNLGAVLIYSGVYIEKGMGLIIPGLTPDTLGEIYEYFPSMTEVLISMGIFSVGFLIYTVLMRVAVPIMLGEFDYTTDFSRKAAPPLQPAPPPAPKTKSGKKRVKKALS